MKKLAFIPTVLLSKEQTKALGLEEQPYIILIPKSVIQKYGVIDEDISFNLIISENKITLVGPTVHSAKEKL